MRVPIILIPVVVTVAFGGGSDRPSQSGVRLAGTTSDGTAYELRFETQRLPLRGKRCTLELAVRRPGKISFERGYRECGPVPRRASLTVATVGYCDPPREAFVLGHLPASASAFVVHLPDGGRLAAQVTPPRSDGSRLYLLTVGGVTSAAEFQVLDDSGRELARDRLPLEDPCSSDEGGVYLGSQRYEMYTGDLAKHGWKVE